MSERTPSSPAVTTSIPAGLYRADAERSKLSFRAKAFGLFWVRGTMPAVEGTLHIEDGRLSGSGVIAASKVDTGVAPRDWHLRSSHYLKTAAHPTIALEVAGAEIAAGTVPCTVTVRGTSSIVPLIIEKIDVVDGALHLQAGVDLDRTPFPMLPPLAGVSRIVHIGLTVVAVKHGD
jgi:polyisoprenoid-binding protein YceI